MMDPFEAITGIALTTAALNQPGQIAYYAELVKAYTDNRCAECGYRLDHPIVTHEHCQ